jgi:anti-anti-sigma factor
MSNSYDQIEATTRDRVLIVKVVATRITEFELAQSLGREMVQAFKESNSSHAIVDLENLAMMSSVGYGPFVDLLINVRNSGGRVVLCKMSEIIEEVFTATRLLINPRSTKSRFEFAPTVEEAMELLATPK